MNEDWTASNVENEDCNLNTEEIDYENLIIRLKEIKILIALLEKKLFR